LTKVTHKQYSICFAYIAAIMMLDTGANRVNYYLSLPILLMAAEFGGKFPDLDHSWNNIADKTVVNRLINILIHVTKGSHRSWQTHSWDICIAFTSIALILPDKLYEHWIIKVVDMEIMSLMLVGFACGWVSHLFSDMLTPEGVRIFCWLKFKLKFVPKRIWRLKFNTGTDWEWFNHTVMRYANIALSILCIAYPILPDVTNKVIAIFK